MCNSVSDCRRTSVAPAAIANTAHTNHVVTSMICRFHIMGGECNYLLRLSPTTKQLEFVPDHEWKTPCMQAWQQEDIKYVLKEAEKLLLDTAYRLRLPVKVWVVLHS